jgi:uncharacterized membrane protein
MTTEARPTSAPVAASLWSQMTWWILALPAAMIVALAVHSVYLLDYTHVLSGALWTGADLFLGFILGPVMRRLEPPQRKAVITFLVPRTLLYMPVVAITTGTAGWFLATWEGFLDSSSPMRLWVFAALAIIAILTVQGLGVLLPNNLRIYRELQRPQPDIARVVRINRTNLVLSGIQGVFQVLIILVMAHLAVG